MTTQSAPIRRLLLATFTAALLCAPGFAQAAVPSANHLNCVQYVKQVSPVSLSGDAYAWWDHANGLYSRGSQPVTGAVMVFAKTRHLPHGHVAIVREQIDSRTLLIDHANWSRFSGHRGQVEQDVRVVDVSPHNDWSAVRVWYHSLGDLGQSVYALRGFIYAKKPASMLKHHGH